MQHKLNPISKNKVKFILSLHLKKQRYKNESFLLEGDKFVYDLVNSKPESIETLVLKKGYKPNFLVPSDLEIFEAEEEVYNKMSSVKNSQNLLAVVSMDNSELNTQSKLWVIIDRIQDPGNIGTILRSCVWYGIKDIVLLKGTADPYEMKSVQASAGTITNVRIQFCEQSDLATLLNQRTLYILDMNGKPLYKSDFMEKKSKLSAITVGNEGQGVDETIMNQAHEVISIPSAAHNEAESLNAAVSLSTALYEWTRPKN